MAQTHIVALSLSDQYNAAIGAVVMRWATLEFQLQHIIWLAMGLDHKQGRVLTVGMNIPTLTRILRNLPMRWITDDAIKAHISGLLKQIEKLGPWRNNVVHGVWTVDPATPEDKPWLNYIKTPEERILPEAEQVTPENLAVIAQAISTLNQVANNILKAIGGEQGGERPVSPEH